MRCPICKGVIPNGGEPSRYAPFCSDRCRLIDLGRWLDGKYQIPVTEPAPDAEPSDQDPDPPSPRDA